MKWFAISGTWKLTNEKVREDVEREVRDIIENGDGIVTGGALGVDFFATETVLKYGDVSKQLKLCLPIRVEDFCSHYLKRAKEGVISLEDGRMIVEQLLKVKENSKKSIFDDWGFVEANKESYFFRNSKIIEMCDVLFAFQVNDSLGTQDAVNKAIDLGKEVKVKKYYI